MPSRSMRWDAPRCRKRCSPWHSGPRAPAGLNAQNVYWTVHGKDATPLDKLIFFMKRADLFLTAIPIEAAGKKPS